MREKIKELSRQNLQNIILEICELLSDEQYREAEQIIERYSKQTVLEEPTFRMSQGFVDEKMLLIRNWMGKIDQRELYLNTEEYEDYSSGYWDSEWITEYYDNQEIGNIILSVLQFAKDCVDDRRYQDAMFIYRWIWEMSIGTDCEWEEECVDLETLVGNDVLHTDLEQVALLTLYTDYQLQKPEKRAEVIYSYFTRSIFGSLHIEDIFRVGKENLNEEGRFWKDWISLLENKTGDVEARLLREAIVYYEGADALQKIAEKNSRIHPSLYLAVLDEYEKNHNYVQMEVTGEAALERIDEKLRIRSDIAQKAAYASSCLGHKSEMIKFCWECFRADSTDKNYLRLFGMQEMAEQYGIRGKEVLNGRIKGNTRQSVYNQELNQNIIGDYQYYKLCFYTGNFKKVKDVSKNPKGSLGWSNSFIHDGIRMFLLYLYEDSLPSKAATAVANYIGFQEDKDLSHTLSFENDIIEESRKYKIGVFWNYFQRWKQYFPMKEEEKEKYFNWAEPIVYGRADAIVSGQYRKYYEEVAGLLAMVAEIKMSRGNQNSKKEIFMTYKKKFPRHSSFQAEMKKYFGNL
jgi:hypothetical protein